MSAHNEAGVSTEALEVETLFDPAALHRRVAELGQRIGEEIGDEDPIVVGLLEGSLFFLVDLVRAVGRPVRFELIQVASGEDSGVIRIEYPIPVDVAGQSILVVKDVVTSGVTEPYLEQQLRDHGARRVRFAALIDVPDARKTDFVPDYSAFTIPPSGTLVGYGLKHQGRYGNLSAVGRIKGTG